MNLIKPIWKSGDRVQWKNSILLKGMLHDSRVCKGLFRDYMCSYWIELYVYII